MIRGLWKKYPAEISFIAALVVVFFIVDAFYIPWHARIVAQHELERQEDAEREKRAADMKAQVEVRREQRVLDKDERDAKEAQRTQEQKQREQQRLKSAKQQMEQQLRDDRQQSEQQLRDEISKGLEAAREAAEVKRRQEEYNRNLQRQRELDEQRMSPQKPASPGGAPGGEAQPNVPDAAEPNAPDEGSGN